jgi:hypothetical protein
VTLLYTLAVLALLVTVAGTWNYILFRKRGYRIYRHNRDQWVYEERTQEGRQSLVLDGEMMSRGPDPLYVPDDTGWRLTVPVWARGRRDEILSRVIALGRGKLKTDATPS